MIVAESAIIRIAPSDLVHLYIDCARCFVQKVRHGVRRPGVFLDVYNVADRAMKTAFADASSEPINLGVGPRFRVVAQGFWVASAPIPFPATELPCGSRARSTLWSARRTTNCFSSTTRRRKRRTA